MDKENQ